MATVLETEAAKAPESVRDEEPLYEIVNGIRVDLPPMSIYANMIAGVLFAEMRVSARVSRSGTPVIEALLILDELADLRRRPDVAFVSAARWPLDREIPEVGDWVVVPDLTVEITSPNDLFPEVLGKVHEYFTHGVLRVWVVIPEERQVYVYRSPTDVTILGIDQTLECELLPGFRLRLAELFQRTAALQS
jgi:Uma2 family endonuclease